MNTCGAENLNQQVGGTIQDLCMVFEFGGCVDRTVELNKSDNPVKRAEVILQRRDQINAGGTGESVALTG